MKRVAFAFGALAIATVAIVSGASAQEGDPALDDLATPKPGPSELDALSEGADADFPDIEAVNARKPISVTLRALNKVTAKFTDVVIDIGATAKFGALELTPRYCDKRPPEEFPETTAFVEIVDKSVERKSSYKRSEAVTIEETAAVEGAPEERALLEGMIFSGWMFKSSPALNGVEHPVYDVWVIDCKTVNIDN